jgi:hypothetical protein
MTNATVHNSGRHMVDGSMPLDDCDAIDPELAQCDSCRVRTRQ